MNLLVHDIRYGFRTLLRSPGYSAVAILTLALGIGGSTALFTLLNALVFRDLPVRDPGRLVSFYGTRNGEWAGITVLQLKELARQQDVFAGLFGRSYPDNSSVENEGQVWPINLGRVTGQYYSVLGIQPVLGRLISSEDDGIIHGDPSAVAVISYDFWQRRYGGKADIPGRTILISDKPFTIIGVTPKGFFGEQVGFSLDVTIPITETPAMPENFPHGPWCQYGVGRLKEGVSLNQARAELESIWPGVRAAAIPAGLTPKQLADLEGEGLRIEAYPKNGYSYFREEFAKPLFVLTEISGIILLITCFNLAILLLARASGRKQEMAIRLALGANRRRLVVQLLVENLAVAVGGALLGIELAAWASRWLVSLWKQIPFNPPTVVNLHPNLAVFLFAAFLAIATGILFGLAPAWHGSRVDPAAALQESSRLGARGARWTGKWLIVAQIALSLTLVTAGGLLVRSLEKVRTVPSGFDDRGVAVIQLQGVTGGNKDYGDAYYQNLVRGMSHLPGVKSAALSQMIPGAGFGGTDVVQREQGVAGIAINADSHVVSTGFFQTLRIGFVEGRDFTWNDNDHAPRVAIISESLARRLFPEGDSVGQLIRVGDEGEAQTIRVIGVVDNARLRDLRRPSTVALYLPFLQQPKYWTNVELRLSAPLGVVLPAGLRLIKEMGHQYVFNADSLSGIVNGALANERALAFISGFFSALALLITAVGFGGLMSFEVAQRTREIGLRMALGAHARHVMRMILGEGAVLVGLGTAVGSASALTVGKLLHSFLFGIQPADTGTLLGAVLLLMIVALLSCWIPARRATRIDPMIALRTE